MVKSLNAIMDKKDILITKDQVYFKIKEVADNPEGSICFIFGAGASYGYSSVKTDFLPPVVADLFNDENLLVREVIRRPKHSFIFGQREYLKRTLLKRYNNDLEQYLSAVYSNRSENDNLFASLLLYLQDIFYLASDRINEHNNVYKDLVSQMFTFRGRLPWSCISFNYDTIFEQSYMFRDPTRSFKTLSNYKMYPKVLKMHGSVNYRYFLKTPPDEEDKNERQVFGLMMDGKKKAEVSLHIQDPKTKSEELPSFYIDGSFLDEKGIRRAAKMYNFPLMMIPIHGTERSENELFIDMLREAKEEISKASLVIAIGYNFGDELFTKEIKDIDLSTKELLLIGTKSLAEDFENHTAYKNALTVWDKNMVKVFDGNGFSEFVDAII